MRLFCQRPIVVRKAGREGFDEGNHGDFRSVLLFFFKMWTSLLYMAIKSKLDKSEL